MGTTLDGLLTFTELYKRQSNFFADALRVLPVGFNGATYTELSINSSGLLGAAVVPGSLPVGYQTFEGTLTAVNSPVTIDVNANLGRNSVDGYLVNDGTGDITVDISHNGSIFLDTFTIKQSEVLELDFIDIDTIRLTHTGTNAGYRCFVM